MIICCKVIENHYFGLTVDQWINISIASATLLTLLCTFFIVRESIRMRKMYATPDIGMRLFFGEATPSLMFLSVENIGMGVAKNIRFDILQDYKFYSYPQDELKAKGMFKTGLHNFYPRQVFNFFINDLQDNHAEKVLEEFIIKVTFSDVFNQKYEKIFNLPIAGFMSTGKFTPPETYFGRISYELEEIKKLYKKDLESRGVISKS